MLTLQAEYTVSRGVGLDPAADDMFMISPFFLDTMSGNTILDICNIQLQFELPHGKTNKMTCAPRKDSDQPGHSPSLIRVFAVRMKKHWVLNYLLSAQ